MYQRIKYSLESSELGQILILSFELILGMEKWKSSKFLDRVTGFRKE